MPEARLIARIPVVVNGSRAARTTREEWKVSMDLYNELRVGILKYGKEEGTK